MPRSTASGVKTRTAAPSSCTSRTRASPPSASSRTSGDSAPTGADEAPSAEDPQDAPAEADPAPKARALRAGTKQAKLIEMLRADGGATIDEIVAETGWQAHTVRGAMSGALKKKLGLTITSEKIEGRGRAYMIADN